MTTVTRRIQIGDLNFGEMVQVSLQDIALQCEVGEFSLAGDLDETCGLQFFHVVRDRSGADGLSRADVGAGYAVAGGDLLEYLVAPRVGEGARNQRQLPVGQSNSLSVSHVAKLVVLDQLHPPKFGFVIRCVPSAAKQFAEKLRLLCPAPKGASEFKELTASLKRRPDTKLEFFSKL